MRTRSAKKLAQTDRSPLLQARAPAAALADDSVDCGVRSLGCLWLGGMAAAGSRPPYSSGPLSTAHAFAEGKCEVCHVRDASFRAHVGDSSVPDVPRRASCMRRTRPRRRIARPAIGSTRDASRLPRPHPASASAAMGVLRCRDPGSARRRLSRQGDRRPALARPRRTARPAVDARRRGIRDPRLGRIGSGRSRVELRSRERSPDSHRDIRSLRPRSRTPPIPGRSSSTTPCT